MGEGGDMKLNICCESVTWTFSLLAQVNEAGVKFLMAGLALGGGGSYENNNSRLHFHYGGPPTPSREQPDKERSKQEPLVELF